jgi:hypothetical protein
MGPTLRKYPRTHHLEGSRFQLGDEDLDSVPLGALAGHHVVIEEKLDGANAGLRFDDNGRLWLQSRGHFLRGGEREKHFTLFKQWAHAHAATLWRRLGSRYAVYGEWLYAKHTVYYDALPHYFLEFDVLDTAADVFLSTERRRDVLAGLPVQSVPVLWAGTWPGAMSRPESQPSLPALVGRSRYKTAAWRQHLRTAARAQRLAADQVSQETDPSDEMEGLYVKVEGDGQVAARYKFVRATFLNAVVQSGSHWLQRPIVPNRLAPDVNLFA